MMMMNVQFRALNAKKDDMTVTVLRDGQKNNISCHKVLSLNRPDPS